MANNFLYVQRYLGDPNNLLQVAVQPLLTKGILNVNSTDIKFTGANTCLVRIRGNYANSGNQYSRANGTVMNDVVGGWKPYTLRVDIGDSVYVDEMDSEEAATSVLIETKQMIRTGHVPKIDKYNLARLAEGATDSATSNTVLTTANAMITIDDSLSALFNQGIARSSEKFLYIKTKAYNLLKQANNITRFLNVRSRFIGTDTSGNPINTEVSYYNECEIVEVPDNYFGTSTLAGQSTVSTGIDYVIVNKQSVFSTIKYDASKILTPQNLPGKFGHQADLRVYFDTFPLLTVKKDGSFPTNAEVVAELTATTPVITACQGIAVNIVTP